MKHGVLFFVLVGVCSSAFARQPVQPYATYGQLIIAQLSSAPFPHPQRASGHTYGKQLYPAAEHYRDSSVAIFIPKAYKQADTVNIIVHLHGWWNNIGTTLSRYALPQQLSESGKNAVLVVPEGPRNAPDSFGGKLEDTGGFKRFIDEVVQFLRQEGIIKAQRAGSVILSGHSGAYHAIAFALLRGGMTENIREVYLFDALYGQTEKFAYWIDHFNNKLITIYTDSGGTKEETESLMEDLQSWNIPFFATDEAALVPAELSHHRLLFIHTDLGHDMVMHAHTQFRDYLKASCLPEQ